MARLLLIASVITFAIAVILSIIDESVDVNLIAVGLGLYVGSHLVSDGSPSP